MKTITKEQICDIMGMTMEEFEEKIKAQDPCGRIEFSKYLGKEGNMRKYAEVKNWQVDVRIEEICGFWEGVEYLEFCREDKKPIFSIYYLGGPHNIGEYRTEQYEIEIEWHVT